MISEVSGQVEEVLALAQQEAVEETSSISARDSYVEVKDDISVDLTNQELLSEFKERKRDIISGHVEYLKKHHELKDVLADFTQLLLIRKPEDVYAFTREYFTKME